MAEDWRAIRFNKLGGVMTIASENFSKLWQFVEQKKHRGTADYAQKPSQA